MAGHGKLGSSLRVWCIGDAAHPKSAENAGAPAIVLRDWQGALLMASRRGQAHHINDDQVHAALLELKELAKLQKSRASSVLPRAEVSGTSGDRARENVVPPVVAISKPSIDRTQDDFQNVQALTDRRSILGRSLRIVIHGLIAFVIVGAAFAWRSSDENTKETIKAWESSLTGLSFLRTINSDDATQSSADANVNAMPAEPTSIHSDQEFGTAQRHHARGTCCSVYHGDHRSLF